MFSVVPSRQKKKNIYFCYLLTHFFENYEPSDYFFIFFLSIKVCLIGWKCRIVKLFSH